MDKLFATRRTKLADMIVMGVLVISAFELLCFNVIIWLWGGVTLVESNKIMLASEIGMMSVLVVLGINLCIRFAKSGGISRRKRL